MIMARKKQQASRLSELLETSEERIKSAHTAFTAANMTLTNARTFGTEANAQAASRALIEAAEIYAAVLRTHARIVVDYAAERS